MSKPLAGIVVLNWNRLDLTKRCLSNLENQTYNEKLVIIIDNGSTDGSVGWLSEQTNVTLIKNKRNFGFARAVNQGIALALGKKCKYVVTLNNDTEIDPTWLEKLVVFMESNPDVSFAQGASMESKNKKVFDSTGIYLEEGFMPRQRASGSTSPSLDTNAIGPNAAGAIYRSNALNELAIKNEQWFDNRFFAYVEDVDFNLRAAARGHRFAFIPAAILHHHGSLTGDVIAKKKMFWGARNQIWLVYKNAPWPVIRVKFKKITVSHLANLQFLWRKQRSNFWPYLAGVVVGVLRLPLLVADRRINMRKQTIANQSFLSLLTPANPPLSNPLRKLINLLK